MDFELAAWCRGADSFLALSMLAWASITAGVVADARSPSEPPARPIPRIRRRRISAPPRRAPRPRSHLRAERQRGPLP